MPTFTGRLRTPVLAAAPASPAVGELYYDTGTNLLYCWNGTIWAAIGNNEIGYDQITANVNVTGSTDATMNTVIAGSAHTFDGNPVIAEFFSPSITLPAVTSAALIIGLWEGATQLGRWGDFRNPFGTGGGAAGFPVMLRWRFTPTAGSHTYSIKALASSTTGTPLVSAGNGVGTNDQPAYLRFTRALN